MARARGAGALIGLGALLLGCSPPPAATRPDGGAALVGPWLAAGTAHTCAIVPPGAVRCWGDNTGGQLGRSGSSDPLRDYTVDLGTGRTARAIAAGPQHTCAILEDGEMKCWGQNTFGQLGLEDRTTRGDGMSAMGDGLPPVKLGTGRTAAAIAAGTEATCVLLDTGQLKCWGNAYGGATGYGDIATRGASPGTMGDELSTVDLGSSGGVPFTVKAVAAVDYHGFCAIVDGGGPSASGLKCWGSNDYCELGLGVPQGQRGDAPGTMGNNLPWVDLGTTSSGSTRTAIALAGGYQFMCALGSDGAVKCWGDNLSGQLGIGVDGGTRSCAPEDVGNAGLVALDGPAVEIAARGLSDGGGAHVCALLATGQVRCWGENGFGQLGTGDTTRLNAPSAPIAFEDGFTPRELVLGDQHSCAISTDARVKCWGNDGQGQLVTAVLGDLHQPGPDAVLRGRSVQAVSAGGDHTCALLAGGAVKCWGRNSDGQLGLGDRVNRGDQPVQLGDSLPVLALGAGRSATSVAAGSSHSCAVLDSGELTCWGANGAGQLGQGDTTGLLAPPSPVNVGGTVSSVAAGLELTCALLKGGTVKCWGANASGQLGLGDTANRSSPSASPIHLGAAARAIAVGDRHVCALLVGNEVDCWGDNSSGQLGLGALPNQLRPAAVDLGAATVKAIAAHGNETCVLLDKGEVTCWGGNGTGQLALGDTTDRSVPTSVPVDLGSGRTATALSVGGAFFCALLDTSQVKCWGDNSADQLGGSLTGTSYGSGPNETGDFMPSVFQGGGRSVKAISSGSGHTCAILDTNDVRCWGDNAYGQLGAGDGTFHSFYSRPTGIVDLGAGP